MKCIILIGFCLFPFLLLSNEEYFESIPKEGFIDRTHEEVSIRVKQLGAGFDDFILGTYNIFGDYNRSKEEILGLHPHLLTLDKDKNTSKVEEYNGPYINKNIHEATLDTPTVENEIDEFFLTRKLLIKQDKSYVRMNTFYKMNSLESDALGVRINLRVALTRSKKKLRLFIENTTQNYLLDLSNEDEDQSTSIGVERDSKEFFGIRPRYSIGFSSLDPFVRARFFYDVNLGSWVLSPIQTFRYSYEEEFSELSEIYLDKATSEHTLLRFLVDRGTGTLISGTRYDGYVQWFWTPKKNTGFSINLGFNGNTHYQSDMDLLNPIVEGENKVFNYLILLKYRQNIFKKWLFYELSPGANYHEKHEYRPNYNLQFSLDLYFGHI